MRHILRIIPPDRRFVLSAVIPADVIPAEDQVCIVEPIGRLDVAGQGVNRAAFAPRLQLNDRARLRTGRQQREFQARRLMKYLSLAQFPS